MIHTRTNNKYVYEILTFDIFIIFINFFLLTLQQVISLVDGRFLGDFCKNIQF